MGPRFDGPLLEESDHVRLTGQLADVLAVLEDHQWHSLTDVSRRSGAPEASASARIRDLRKPKFGGYVINRRHLGNGLYEYQLAPPPPKPTVLLQETVWGMPEIVPAGLQR